MEILIKMKSHHIEMYNFINLTLWLLRRRNLLD